MKKVLSFSLLASSSVSKQAIANDVKVKKLSQLIYEGVSGSPELQSKFSTNNINEFIFLIKKYSSAITRQKVKQRISKDFSCGNTVTIKGYIFSHTEVLVCLSGNYMCMGSYVV